MNMRNQVATREEQRTQQQATVASFIQGMGPELQRALPKNMDGDRIVRIATTLIRRSELERTKGNASVSLAQCTRESFAAALLTSSALGLEPGINGQAWLIPYRDTKLGIVECQLVVGYQGLVELAQRHPNVGAIRSGVIYATDDPSIGPIGTLDYVSRIGFARLLAAPEGDPIGFWASVELRQGGMLVEIMSPAQILALRKKQPVGEKAKIPDPQHWMSRKTVLKQVLRTAPRSIEAVWAERVDEQTGAQLHVEQIPAGIAQDAMREIEAVPAGVDPVTGEVDPATFDGPLIPPSN